MSEKKVFTTGEIANLLHIHQTTIIDWIDKGLLASYKTPGGHRRITRESLFLFLENHDMPIPNHLTKEPSNAKEDEAHRHGHEGFQIGPKTKPMEAFPPLAKKTGSRNVGRRDKLQKKH